MMDNDEIQREVKPAREKLPSLSPPFSFPIQTFPHVLSLILDYSTDDTLATLSRCSKSLSKPSSRLLYDTLRVTGTQFIAMVHAGWDLSKSRSGLGRLQGPYSSSLYENFSHTRSIHFLDYDITSQDHPEYLSTLKIPTGLFSKVRHVILYGNTRIYSRLSGTFTFFDGFNADFYLWVTGQVGLLESPIVFNRSPFPPNFTLLVSEAYMLDRAPQLITYGSNTSPPKIQATVVIVPWDMGTAPIDHQKEMVDRWVTPLQGGEAYKYTEPTIIVGTEFTGVSEERCKQYVFLPSGEGYKGEFRSFPDWLGGLEFETVFTKDEAKKMKDLAVKFNAEEDD